MKVHLVLEWMPYEGEEIIHIASTYELAEQWLENYKKSKWYKYYILEWDVDAP